jgi:short-subunit dehydrogenase
MRSLLCSTASIAGHYPIPFAATYSASKRFVDQFSWAMMAELSAIGVDVCTWQTATVSTKMTSYARGFLAATPDAYASSALSRCTSGANAGILKHDLILNLIEFIADVIPLTVLMNFVARFSKKSADKVKARTEAKKNLNTNKNGYQKFD